MTSLASLCHTLSPALGLPKFSKDVLHKDQLGNQSLAVIYIVFALANFIAPPIVHKVGPRVTMFFVRRRHMKRECQSNSFLNPGFLASFRLRLHPELCGLCAVHCHLSQARSLEHPYWLRHPGLVRCDPVDRTG